MQKNVKDVMELVEEVIKSLNQLPTEILERLEVEISSELFFRSLNKTENN